MVPVIASKATDVTRRHHQHRSSLCLTILPSSFCDTYQKLGFQMYILLHSSLQCLVGIFLNRTDKVHVSRHKSLEHCPSPQRCLGPLQRETRKADSVGGWRGPKHSTQTRQAPAALRVPSSSHVGLPAFVGTPEHPPSLTAASQDSAALSSLLPNSHQELAPEKSHWCLMSAQTTHSVRQSLLCGWGNPGRQSVCRAQPGPL